MQIENLIGVDKSQLNLSVKNSRVVILSARLRSHNALLTHFIGEPDTLLYALSAQDNRLGTLLQNLVETLSSQSLGYTYSQLRQALSDGHANAVDYADALAADLNNLPQHPPFLILDEFDYHKPSPDLTAFFQHLVKCLPQDIRLVVNGRGLEFSPWRELLQSGQAVVLGEALAMNGGIFTVENMDTPQLEVYGFGTGRVFVDGRSVDIWDGPLTRSLFFYFVDHPLFSRDEIFQTFWPDLELKEATNVFHVTKRKLSERLGIEMTSYSSGFYRLSATLRLHYDVAEFEASYRRADACDSSAAVDSWHRAIYLYRSRFLHNMDRAWIQDRREQLQREYTEALIGLGRYYKSTQDMDRSVHYFVRALREQPSREDIHREVMTIYYSRGQIEAAISQYRQLEAFLQHTLCIRPAPTTVSLYERIIGASH